MSIYDRESCFIESVIETHKKRHIEKELICFFTLTIFLSWLFWTPAFLKAYGIQLFLPEELLIKFGNFTPSLIAVILTLITLGKIGTIEMLKGIIKVRYDLKWYIYTLFLMPCILTLAYIISYFASGVKFESILISVILPQVWTLFPLIAYFVIMQGPLGEELGWRGYALPRLLQTYNPLKASVIVGAVWALWHFPKFFITDTIQYSIGLTYGVFAALIGYTFYTVMLSLMITLLMIKTGGSIWATLLFHAMANFSHGLITILTNTTGGISIILVMVISTSIILKLFRRDLLLTHSRVKWKTN
ncbi:CPBP family intramembrane metalloprotease [Alkaliphilus pronyensis]|uniref:CPBP family intramembrane metalloprotease n=1 Tax=Alkaliphilus pronyensis TaxID=1482732 RepID=A0A6I0F8Y4_9FIRM|nr:CPBP family intramembrane glutamic endopeptidase [Alkaliphilus pronyensis]KAB3538545.1 CPBP family intramembrane metalloprotease [Alkaliphilus pronyensis]